MTKKPKEKNPFAGFSQSHIKEYLEKKDIIE